MRAPRRSRLGVLSASGPSGDSPRGRPSDVSAASGSHPVGTRCPLLLTFPTSQAAAEVCLNDRGATRTEAGLLQPLNFDLGDYMQTEKRIAAVLPHFDGAADLAFRA